MTSDQIQLLVLDVDGVLTDGCFSWSEVTGEVKKFSFRDINGVALAMRSGMEVALVSGEDSPITMMYAKKMGISHVIQGCKDKLSAVSDLAQSLGLAFSEIAYMGDDYQDYEAMEACGISACPVDAHSSVKEIATYVVESAGGNGAVRNFIDLILSRQN